MEKAAPTRLQFIGKNDGNLHARLVVATNTWITTNQGHPAAVPVEWIYFSLLSPLLSGTRTSVVDAWGAAVGGMPDYELEQVRAPVC
jgi:hypothetical protein